MPRDGAERGLLGALVERTVGTVEDTGVGKILGIFEGAEVDVPLAFKCIRRL